MLFRWDFCVALETRDRPNAGMIKSRGLLVLFIADDIT